MKILFQILSTMLLLLWPLVAFFSVMMFDAPGSSNDAKRILTVLLILFYPVLLGLGYYYFNQNFWGLSPCNLLIICILVPAIGSLALGYPRMLINSFEGVPAEGYFVNDKSVYLNGQKMDADPKTFIVPNNKQSFYSKDKNYAFYRSDRITGADVGSFAEVENAGSIFSKDKIHVYYKNIVLEGADPLTFKALVFAQTSYRMYFADGKSVYFADKKLPNFDVETAELVSANYIKDKSSVYFLNKKLEGVNAEKFKATPEDSKANYDAGDGVNFFLQGERVK